ncbi:BRCA1-associated RING domain protein 1 [Syngnathus typhle]|uniref:BRCA1-associated RING domain protein 1 n=1 Tax=Syngnathus typhle TaxID=161592 RepID=UPI002A6B47B2|nr:BRCA1-associated RING domain protein 1 [Syngnathus typhle]
MRETRKLVASSLFVNIRGSFPKSEQSEKSIFTAMDAIAVAQTNEWKNTKEAIANFRHLLLCSKCSQLLKDPVCLGTCEHMLCRSCAGPKAGDGCVVCHSPSWVKDIKTNRQLNSIIPLFCDLEAMLYPDGQADSSEIMRQQNEGTVLKCKKNFKIWLSPRSRKMRCVVKRNPEVTTPESKSEAQPGASAAAVGDMTIFNFTSSSQDSGSSSPAKSSNKKQNRKTGTNAKKIGGRKKTTQRASKKQSRQMVRKNLDSINEQWRIIKEQSEHFDVEGESTSHKKVSFISPDGATCINDLRPVSSTRTLRDGLTEGRVDPPKSSTLNKSDTVYDTVPASILKTIPKKQTDLSSPRRSSKRQRPEGEVVALETTPKRPTASTTSCQKSLGHSSPAVANSPSLPKRRCKKLPREGGGESPTLPLTQSRKSPSSRASRANPGSPTVVKKNHKGETLLHLAAIKGDVEGVKELLDQGADPNLKDNAGWTPLHEACNLGHLAVVETLLSRGSLLNTPGYKNDSPLHDAVRNGHIAVVKLLLQFGASRNVLNLDGKRPADYAANREMLEVFQEVSEETQNASTSTNSPAARSVAVNCAKQEEMVLFVSSKLSQTDQHQIAKLSRLLDGRITDSVTSSVSHLVVPEGPMPSTYSTLLGLLAGCWIVKYSWVEACLQAGKRMPENEHEAGEGPQRSRINRCSLLPPLFDGCFFFLLGSFKSHKKDELAKLLRDGGGQLLSRRPKPDSDVTQTLSAAAYHALPGSDQALGTQYIIFDRQGPHKPSLIRKGKVWSAPSTWVIDCITSFRILPVPNFELA